MNQSFFEEVLSWKNNSSSLKTLQGPTLTKKKNFLHQQPKLTQRRNNLSTTGDITQLADRKQMQAA